MDWKLLMPPGFQILPRRWVVERTFSWIAHNGGWPKITRGCVRRASFIYAAMIRLIEEAARA